ncbi:curli production assembly/transport component CsgG [Kordia sp. SMS9]|uniref:FlgO family outer membrane protein n=1 Tax=Kordia sp. SMS9 TaxID=2282170 RepID=UPI000E0CBF96|nr:FlgO family outer membrane protein [Kordia sp. SMS9]AXG69807.1 curli production assembly/transport component CsgG [Kordia sp. SMS9]
MKRIMLLNFIFIICNFSNLYAQDFDIELKKLAETIAAKLNGKEKKKIAVWGFVTENGERTSLGNYITEDFSIYITNAGEQFEVIDRNHLDTLLKEHKLNSEGYIDDATAKKLGKIIAVDAVITGTYSVLDKNIKVRVKVLDTETALQFAAAISKLAINEDVASYLGVNVNGSNTKNKGFNRPLASGESVNNPETVDPKCREGKFGDLCFYNSTNKKVIVVVKCHISKNTFNPTIKNFFLQPKETKCVYGLKSIESQFFIATWTKFNKEIRGNVRYLTNDRYRKYLKDFGELKVETCKSKTYTIK